MAHGIPLPPSPHKAARPRHARHFDRVEPMHRTPALDSRGMDIAIARGPR
jgi:hypothetical protein